MAWFVVVGALVACASESDDDRGTDPYLPDSECPAPRPEGTCHCSPSKTWLCSTCPFSETAEPVACTTVGAACQIVTWEHGCACACDASGWWSCTPETVGSVCPMLPAGDAGAR